MSVRRTDKKARLSHHRRRRDQRRRTSLHQFRPSLEQLEDRSMMAGEVVNSTNDIQAPSCSCECPSVQTAEEQATANLIVEGIQAGISYFSGLLGQVTISTDVTIEGTGVAMMMMLSSSVSTATSLEVRLTYGTLDPVSVFYDPAGLVPQVTDETYRFSVQVDASSLPIGQYHYVMEFIEHYEEDPDIVDYIEGDHKLVNLAGSQFGSGWLCGSLSGLHPQPEGVLLVKADGTSLWFTEDEGEFIGQVGDLTFSTLEFDGEEDLFTLRARNGDVSIFDESGLQLSQTDRFGNTTEFAYIDADEDELVDELSTITDPVGRVTTYGYTSGVLDTITDFRGNVTQLVIDGGQVVEIIEPDIDGAGPAESGSSTFDYNATTGRLEGFTRPLGGPTTFTYDHAGGLETRTNPNEEVLEYLSEQTQAVVDTSGGVGASDENLAEVINVESMPGWEANELGQETHYVTNRLGYVVSETNHLGQTTTFERNANGQPTRITGPAASGGVDFQFIQELVYDNGNLVSVAHVEGLSYGLITEYEYDETWIGFPVSIMSYSGATSPAETLAWTLLTLDETTGAVLESRQVQGELDDEINEETDDLVETFTYTALPESSGDPPAGLVASYTNAGGVTTLYDYNEHGLLIEVTLASGTADEATLAFEYDSDDNLTAEVDELGRRTEHTYNEVGNRLTTTLPDPDGSGGGNPLESPVYDWEYNVMGRVTLAVDPLERETEFVYGAFGKLVEQTLSGNGFDPVEISFGYDIAGRNTSSTDGLGRTTTHTLDALGRVSETTLPDPDSGGELEAPVFAHTYSSLGSIATSTDALGNVTSVAVSNYGRTVTTTLPDPDGGGSLESPVYVQHFDVLGRLIEEVDPRGGSTTYAYNMLSQLVEQVTPDPDGELTQYESSVFTWTYDANGNILTATDANLATTAYVYDSRDRLIEVYLPDAETGEPVVTPSYVYVFDAASQLLSETDPLGRETQHEYDNLGRQTALILNDPDAAGPLTSPEYHYSYDAASRLILEVAPNGAETDYEYDLLDNVILVRPGDPDGVGSASRPEYEFVYDAASQLISETNPLGATTLHTFDNLGREIATQTADPDGAGELEASVWQYHFDALSNLVLAIDPLLNETAYEFDNLQRRTKIIDAEAGETSFTFDAASNLLSVTDPVANTTSWVYDALNRVVEEENELEASRFFRYDAMSTLIEKTDRNNRVTQYVPDFRGRIVQENWRPGASLSVETATEGFQANEVQRVGFSDTSEITGGTFTLTLDSETTDPLAFDADAATVETALVALTSIGNGNASVTKLQSSSTTQEWEITFTGALAAANQSQVTIASGSVTHTGTLSSIQTTETHGSSIDEVQVVTIDGAETGTFTLTLDSETTDPIAFDASAGAVETALEALTAIGSGNVSVTGSAGGPWTITFGGTLAGTNVAELVGDKSNLASTTILRSFDYEFDEANQLLSAADPSSEFAFVYDGLGRVTEETLAIAGLTPEIVLAKTWDVMGNRLSLSATIGEDADFENSYTFDVLNRMTQVIQAGQSGGNAVATKRIDMGYNALGQFATLERYQSANTSEYVATTTYGYDEANHLLSLYHEQGETVLAGYDFAQDALGRITSLDSVTDGLSEFSYDATSQVTGADHTGQDDEAHVWDANGNPDGEDFEVGPNNRLLEDADYFYEHDAEGNLTKKTEKATGDYVVFDWDHRNRLTKASFFDSEDTLLKTVDNAYDVFNRWIRRTLDEDGPGGTAAIDRFFAGYDGLDATLQFEGPDAADLSNRYLWGAQVDQLLADESIESLIAEGDVLWPFLDQLGTARDLGTYNPGTNETSIANHRVYNASGSLISETNSSVILVFSFTGKPLDDATGLIQYVHRWYDPFTGRFASEDPIGFRAGDANIVRYVGNSFLNAIDPLGLLTGRPGDGHHVVNQANWAGMIEAVQDVFNAPGARIRNDYYTFHGSSTVNGVSHYAYNAAIAEELRTFLNGRDASTMTVKEAKAFLKKIQKSTNPVISAFNEGIKAEAFAAEVAGKAAEKNSKKARKCAEEVKEDVTKAAEVAVKKTRDLINERASKKAQNALGNAATETVLKQAGKKTVGIIPFLTAGITLFSTGDLNAAGREAFLDLTGLDTATAAGEFLGIYYDQVERWQAEDAEYYRNLERFDFTPNK